MLASWGVKESTIPVSQIAPNAAAEPFAGLCHMCQAITWNLGACYVAKNMKLNQLIMECVNPLYGILHLAKNMDYDQLIKERMNSSHGHDEHGIWQNTWTSISLSWSV
eukprot:c10205_g1_i1 orf=255-578(+)